ncbi:MAG: aldo/keto reductase [Myxococcota bacterium]
MSEGENDGRGGAARLDRRAFLQRSALGLGGLAWLPGCGEGDDPADAGLRPADPHIRRRATLGRTGIEIPDISFGGWGLEDDEDVVRHALDRGVTHFDTAPDYADGLSETTIGRALGGDRQRVTLATKVAAHAGMKRDEIMASLEASLRRFGTDHVDVFFNHAVNKVARIRNPEWWEFVARAKQQGKIRASGMSGHGGNLARCVDEAIDGGQTDVFLLAHNYANDPGFWGLAQRFRDVFTGGFDMVAYQSELPRLIQRAHDAELGVMVMKTRRGARYNDLSAFRGDGANHAQAAFRWVLSDPRIHGLVVTMWSREIVDQFVAASGSAPPTAADARSLLRYEARNARSICQPGCDACAGACPAGVDVAGTLRTRMYAERYGRPDVARVEYGALAGSASPCLQCASPVCASACPAKLDIRRLAGETHRLLG